MSRALNPSQLYQVNNMDLNRKTAYKALFEIQIKGAYSNIAVNRQVRADAPSDPAFVRSLVYGTLENQLLIDHRLSQLVKGPLKKVNSKALVLLRMGVCQLDFMDSVPEYAAINETVSLAKKFCRGLDGFVNGVLRSYLRRDGSFSMPDREKNPSEYLSIKYSCSSDIVKMWLDIYGQERTESLLKAGNTPPPLTIRVNSLKAGTEEVRTLLEAGGFKCSPALPEGCSDGNSEAAGRALNVSGSGLMDRDWYRQGLFSVQDLSSMLAVSALDPRPGQTLIDICAAPGGKSFFAGELMKNQGRIISCDIHPHKVELIKQGAARLGLTCLEAMENDGLTYREEFAELADRVIVDAPCSGLGVVRRKPEIKLHLTLDDIKELAGIQLEILEKSSAYVKKNGLLMYSTCTISQVENEAVTEMFLQKNKNFSKVCSRQLFPDIDNSDGFYFTVFQRI